MDAARFDALLRLLYTRASRRGTLAGLASGLLMVGPLTPGGHEAGAKKKRKHKKRHKEHQTCKSGTDTCQGQCVALCPGGQVRNPLTCGCCQVNNEPCSSIGANPNCCSGTCAPDSGNTLCAARGVGEPCDFSAQCETEFCSPAGLCLFAAP